MIAVRSVSLGTKLKCVSANTIEQPSQYFAQIQNGPPILDVVVAFDESFTATINSKVPFISQYPQTFGMRNIVDISSVP